MEFRGDSKGSIAKCWPFSESNLLYDVRLLSGHNFGSEHDPDTSECAPADNQEGGGKYIMYPASVSGQLRNNKVMQGVSITCS